MAAKMLRTGVVVSSAVTPCAADDAGRSRDSGLNALRWIGLLTVDSPADFDELACQSLMGGDHCGDDPSTWFA